MEYAYKINTQNVEEYGENFYKYKGGSTYFVKFDTTKEIWEENAYGEGKHEYYYPPSLTEATACALVMQHVNRYNGLQGSFDYITESEVVHDYQIDEYEEETYFPATFTGTESDLIADIDNSREVHYDNHGELNVTP